MHMHNTHTAAECMRMHVARYASAETERKATQGERRQQACIGVREVCESARRSGGLVREALTCEGSECKDSADVEAASEASLASRSACAAHVQSACASPTDGLARAHAGSSPPRTAAPSPRMHI